MASLVLALIAYVPLISVDESNSTGQEIEIPLREQNWKGKNLFLGTLDLGDIKAGSRVTASILLRNDSEFPIEIQRVVPSCACSDLRIPRQTIGSQEVSIRGVLSVSIPQVLGQNFRLAEIQMFESETAREPIAVVEVTADIYRPYSIRSARINANVGLEDDQVIPIEFDLHPQTQISDLEILVESSDVKVTLDRKTKARGVIRIHGSRKSLLNQSTIVLRLSHKTEKISDQILVDLLDSSKMRLLAVNISDERKVNIRVFRQSGIAPDRVKVFVNEVAVKADIAGKSEKLVAISVSTELIASTRNIQIELTGPSNTREVLDVPIPLGENDD